MEVMNTLQNSDEWVDVPLNQNQPNKDDEWVDIAPSSTNSDLTKSAIVVHNIDADKYAQNKKNVVSQGIPASFATPANKPVNADDMYNTINDFQKLNGKTAEHMSNIEFAKVAHDDTKPLSKLESVGKFFKRFNDVLYGDYENVLNLGTGIVGATVGAVAGLTTLGLSKAMTGKADVEFAKNVHEKLADFLTYKPQSETGQLIFEDVNKPVSILGAKPTPILSLPAEIGKELVKPVLQSTNAPEEIAYPVNTITEFASYPLTGKLIKVISGKMAEHIQTIIDTAKESKLAKRDSVLFKNFVDEIVQESLPIKIPVEKINEVLIKNNLNPDEILSDSSNYYEAKVFGEKVDISVKDLAANAKHFTSENVKDMSVEGIPSISEMELKEVTQKDTASVKKVEPTVTLQETATKPTEPKSGQQINLEGIPEKPAKKSSGKSKDPESATLYSGIDPTIAIDIMKNISAKTSEIYEATQIPPEIAKGIQAAKDSMIEHHRSIRRAESTSKLFEKIVDDMIPKPERQMLLVHAYENKMKGKYWDQLNEIEKGVVRWIAEEKTKQAKFIKDNDILEMMPESPNINHIYHSWIDKVTGEPYKSMYGKFSKGLPQAKQRVIPTYEKGIELGEIPATTNIGKLVGLELESITRANSARGLFKTLHKIKGEEGATFIRSEGGNPKPLRMVEDWKSLEEQGLTDGYIRYDSQFLDKAITHKSEDGRIVTIKGAVGIKEELYPFVHSYIDNPQYGTLSKLNFAAKSLKLGASLFHVMSLGMQEVANIRTPFVHIPKGLKLAKELSPSVRLLHQEGLELFKGYEDLGSQGKFFDNASIPEKVGNVVTWPITKMRDFIFNYVQPGMKVSFSDMLLNKLLPRYLDGTEWTKEQALKSWDEGTPMPPEVKLKLQWCAREVVQKSDGHFSGEDFKRSMLETNRFMVKMYFTPETRVKWQAALLSPTWQREHLLVAKNVAKSFMPDSMIKKLGMSEMGAIKSQYRRYVLGAIMMIGSVDLWNYQSTLLMDGEGKHLWENPKGKGFAVRAWWNEPAYISVNKKGKEIFHPETPAYIRPLKSVFEIAEWVHDPVKKVGYKLSPAVSAMGEQLFGMKKYDGLPDIPERIWDYIIDSSTPIVMDQAINTAQGKQSVEATVLPFFGFPTSRGKFESMEEQP
jgi:hypothetical protein